MVAAVVILSGGYSDDPLDRSARCSSNQSYVRGRQGPSQVLNPLVAVELSPAPAVTELDSSAAASPHSTGTSWCVWRNWSPQSAAPRGFESPRASGEVVGWYWFVRGGRNRTKHDAAASAGSRSDRGWGCFGWRARQIGWMDRYEKCVWAIGVSDQRKSPTTLNAVQSSVDEESLDCRQMAYAKSGLPDSGKRAQLWCSADGSVRACWPCTRSLVSCDDG